MSLLGVDGVGSRVLAYYSKQDASQLTDAALSQRSRALSLMAEVADARGHSDTALKLYREAMAGTAEAMRRDPANAQAIFEHAQNVFYVGEIAQNSGDLKSAEASMREYQRLAHRMVALQPDSMKYRMEVQYADVDLGIVYWTQRRFAESATQFDQALQTIQALASADTGNAEYQKQLVEALAWLADARAAEGQLGVATKLRERHVEMLNAALLKTGDVVYRQKLVVAERALGNVYGSQGDVTNAVAHLRAAVGDADLLTTIEPDNTLWLASGFRVRLDLERYLLATGDKREAEAQAIAACKIVEHLLTKDPQRPEWRGGLRDCWIARSRIALANNQHDEAVAGANQAVRVGKSLKTSDPVGDSYSLAGAYLALGDALNANGKRGDAAAAWAAGLSTLPTAATERPQDTKQRALLMNRLGRDSSALMRRLAAIGYRSPLI